MSKSFIFQVLLFTAIVSALVSCKKNMNTNKPDTIQTDTTPPIKTTVLTDDDMLPNQRFGKSEIVNPKYPPELLFGTWATKDNPACDFIIDKEKLFLCDLEGNSNRLYRIDNDSIFLDNPTLIFKGKILNVTQDSLVIHWQQNEKPEVLLRWKE